MANHEQIIQRWLDVALKRTDKQNYNGRNSNVYGVGDSIFSYGRHFEMARIIRNAKDEPTFFLVNGDTYSVSTARHQSYLRSALRGEDLPSVILPFSALTAASIDWNTIEPIDIRADRMETKYHETTERPLGSVWRTVEEHGYIDLTEDELNQKLDAVHVRNVEDWECRKQWAERDPDGYWAKQFAKNPDPPARRSIESLMEHERRRYGKTGEHLELFRNGRTRWDAIKVTDQEDGSKLYEWETRRHWLGDSLIRARVRWAGRSDCRQCSGSGLTQDYKHLRNTQSEGFWNLATEDRDKARCQKCWGRGRTDWTRSRLAYFISSFDYQESRPLYFFCELPQGVNPETVADAIECLKPNAVKLAEELGRNIVRQGDIFAISLRDMDRRTLTKQGARFEKRGNLLGTNHEATEVAYLPNGWTVVRGMLYHNPGWRDPDHARRKLTDGWSVVIKNTVPVSR